MHTFNLASEDTLDKTGVFYNSQLHETGQN